MKKRIMAALMAIMMIVSLLPTGASALEHAHTAEHTHAAEDGNVPAPSECTHANWEWVTDSEGHQKFCSDCGEALTEWGKHLKSDDICYICYYGNDCPHENWYWYTGNATHAKFCHDCGWRFTEDEPHTAVDGYCTECGYKICYHKNWHWERDYYGHNQACVDCGAETTEWENHTEIGGVCDICGLGAECTHPDYYWSIDTWTDTHAQVCRFCDTMLTMGESHDMVDGICSSCGYVPCPHRNLEWYHNDEGNHWSECPDCDEETYHEEHTLVDGVCAVCGAAPCADGQHSINQEHTCESCGATAACRDVDRDCACDYCGGTMHLILVEKNEVQHRWACEKCGYASTEWEDHTGIDTHGYCLICGYSGNTVCYHPKEGWYIDELYHTVVCAECGEELSKPEEHAYENGACIFCGHEKTCMKHENCYWSADPWQHVLMCRDCGQEADLPMPHEFVDGVCTVCDWVECKHENADWAWDIEGHWYYCMDCGYGVSQPESHAFKDGLCVCGYAEGACPHQSAGMQIYGEYHAEFCWDCGTYLTEPEAHTYGDDGNCTVCGFRYCAHERLGWSWDDQSHAPFCMDCGYDLSEPVPHEYVDGICQACGNVERCLKCENFYWEIDTEGHIEICVDCGHIFTHWEPHEFVDGVCTVCDYVEGTCTHRHRGLYIIAAYHVEQCWDCGEYLTEPEPHEFVDGYCTVCKLEYCPHESQHWIWETNSHAPVCDSCNGFVADWEPHEFVDGICICGYEYCAHESQRWIWTANNHAPVCDSCGGLLGDWVPHEFVDGVCACGYEACAHKNLGWSYNSDCHAQQCMDCGYVVSEWVPHDFVNGVCQICDYVEQCPKCEDFYWETTPWEHIGRCKDCGHEYNSPCPQWEPHEFVDGVCQVCGYEQCRHENTELLWIDHMHLIRCWDCGEELGYEEHDIQWHHNENGEHYRSCDCGYYYSDWHELNAEGVCTVCGAKPCADGAHESGKDHICAVCGCETYCRDENNDCCCEICGGDMHQYITRYDDKEHWQECARCGATVSYGEHSIGDDGICTEWACGYGCDHNSDRPMWWMTGEWHCVSCTICNAFLGELVPHDYQWEWDDGSHRIACTGCPSTETDWMPHSFVDGVCSDCGYGCDHAETETNCNVEYHWQWCLFCGQIVNEAEHSFGWSHDEHGWHYERCTECAYINTMDFHKPDENGVCTECGATPCADGAHEPGEDHICTLCGSITYCADENKDCKCDVCGDEMHDIRIIGDETGHGEVCIKCGMQNYWEEHYGIEESGFCHACGYGCDHAETETNCNVEYHWQWCLFCGQIVNEAEHSFGWSHDEHGWHYERCTECAYINTMDFHKPDENGVCTECGAKPCDDGEHIYEGSHSCSICGCTNECRDYDANCVCDICGKEMHLFLWERNETQHRIACALCGIADTEWSDHQMNDQGICVNCCYGCEHSNLDYSTYAEYQGFHVAGCRMCGQSIFLEEHTPVWYHNEDGWHLCYCELCNYTLTEEGKHTLVDGVCTECGVKPCAAGTHQSGEDHICTVCGCVTYCVDEDGDCKCDICGNVEHLYLPVHNETQHRIVCAVCGDVATEWENHGDMTKGYCPDCGYGCSHESWELIGNRTWHLKVCNNCGWQASELEKHTDADKDGKCDVCGMEDVQFAEPEKPIMMGDVSGDGLVTVQDAILVLRYVAKLINEISEAAADVSGDGPVSVQDAILILRYVAKLITEFPNKG